MHNSDFSPRHSIAGTKPPLHCRVTINAQSGLGNHQDNAPPGAPLYHTLRRPRAARSSASVPLLDIRAKLRSLGVSALCVQPHLRDSMQRPKLRSRVGARPLRRYASMRQVGWRREAAQHIPELSSQQMADCCLDMPADAPVLGRPRTEPHISAMYQVPSLETHIPFRV